MQLTTKSAFLSNSNALISMKDVSKEYKQGKQKFPALKSISLEILSGELLFITGRSGSGKSTLLNMISGIDRPSSGRIFYKQLRLDQLSEDDLARWRGNHIGVVFQFFQLIPSLTILENILIAMDFNGKVPRNERRKQAFALLEKVGIVDQANKLPSTLSGGQQQRAAIARGLANNPDLLIADEPTGNLDSGTAEAIFAIFNELVADGKTVVIVTHDREFAKMGTRTISMVDGELQEVI